MTTSALPSSCAWLSATAALTLSLCGQAQAGESYGAIGFPGAMGGYAHDLNERMVLRADYARLGSRRVDGAEEGIYYRGHAKFRRIGLFADFFPARNGLRLTTGLTLNHMKVDLNSDLAGGMVNVGGVDYAVGQGAYFNVRVTMPKVTPYLGIGWGHHRREAGWGLVADIGLSLGKPRLALDTNLDERGVAQSDIDRELAQLRDGVGQIRAIPQISVGMSYRY